jgi:hypothetical protein
MDIYNILDDIKLLVRYNIYIYVYICIYRTLFLIREYKYLLYLFYVRLDIEMILCRLFTNFLPQKIYKIRLKKWLMKEISSL